jgi:hypothetical protein
LVTTETLSDVLNNNSRTVPQVYRVELPEIVTIMKGLQGEADNTCYIQQIFSLNAAHFGTIKRNGTSALNVLCCACSS